MQNGCKTVSFTLVILMEENSGVQRHEGGFLNIPTPALLSVLVEDYIKIPRTLWLHRDLSCSCNFCVTAVVIKVKSACI